MTSTFGRYKIIRFFIFFQFNLWKCNYCAVFLFYFCRVHFRPLQVWPFLRYQMKANTRQKLAQYLTLELSSPGQNFSKTFEVFAITCPRLEHKKNTDNFSNLINSTYCKKPMLCLLNKSKKFSA